MRHKKKNEGRSARNLRRHEIDYSKGEVIVASISKNM